MSTLSCQHGQLARSCLTCELQAALAAEKAASDNLLELSVAASNALGKLPGESVSEAAIRVAGERDAARRLLTEAKRAIKAYVAYVESYSDPVQDMTECKDVRRVIRTKVP